MTSADLYHSSVECDGECAGCAGSGRHPHAGTGATNKDRIDSDAKCSWCDGDGQCQELHTDEPHAYRVGDDSTPTICSFCGEHFAKKIHR